MNRRTDIMILSGMSFMKVKKRNCPKTVSWGTPDKTGTVSEAKLWSCQKMCDALHYLLENIFIRFGSNYIDKM